MMKVVLVGYMGSGKSSVGKLLGLQLGIPFYDLDAVIEDIEQLSISDLFEKKGELYFRKSENKILKQILHKDESIVLSLGGGTPCYYNNHELLLQDGVVSFYLKATSAKLVERLQVEKESRPLVASLNKDELLDFVNKHLFDRSYYYHQVNHVVAIDEKSVDQLVDEIVQQLR
ncbi:MAG: shikimate kinase [Flavobacterium sp.]|nr:shikimate kinase [Flavobacterium sp.]